VILHLIKYLYLAASSVDNFKLQFYLKSNLAKYTQANLGMTNMSTTNLSKVS